MDKGTAQQPKVQQFRGEVRGETEKKGGERGKNRRIFPPKTYILSFLAGIFFLPRA